jgi:hypothetical protein
MMAVLTFVVLIGGIAAWIVFFKDSAKPFFSWVPFIDWDGTPVHTIEMATFDSDDADFMSVLTQATGGVGVTGPGDGTTVTDCIIRKVELVSLDDEEVEMDGLSIPLDGDALEIKADDDSGDAGKGAPVSQATIKDQLKIRAEILVPASITSAGGSSTPTMTTTDYPTGAQMNATADTLLTFSETGDATGTGYYKIIVSKDVDSLTEASSVYSWDIFLSNTESTTAAGTYVSDQLTLQFKFSFGEL